MFFYAKIPNLQKKGNQMGDKNIVSKEIIQGEVTFIK